MLDLTFPRTAFNVEGGEDMGLAVKTKNDRSTSDFCNNLPTLFNPPLG